ncbi:hypothetical protein F4805DRAFT_248823 [Annulohypoxylon moriforme]|nr:hypothetical protein F4805DRAFT_248823 [Annulohypoxylon moriforme]
MTTLFRPERCRGLMTREEASRASLFLSREIVDLPRRKLETTQIRTLFRMSEHVDDSFLGKEALEVHLGWILERYKVWRFELSAPVRHRYLTELVAWRSIQGTHDGMWMAYFLPGILHFRLFPPRDPEPSLDNNWFVWWWKEGRQQEIAPAQDPEVERAREVDRWFISYIAFRDENGPDAEMPIDP